MNVVPQKIRTLRLSRFKGPRSTHSINNDVDPLKQHNPAEAGSSAIKPSLLPGLYTRCDDTDVINAGLVAIVDNLSNVSVVKIRVTLDEHDLLLP
jgi:hypothetical protein